MIFLAILLTAFVYLIFPILYVANNGKVSPKKGKKLALSNTIICAAIFFLLTLIIVSTTENVSAEIGGYSLAPAFLYYFIAKAIFTDKNLSDDDNKKSKTEKDKDSSTEPDAGESLLNDDTTEEITDQIDNNKPFPPNSLKQLPPELLALLAHTTHISIQDDAPAEDYVNKVRQKTIKDAQPEIDELYFKTFLHLNGKEVSDDTVDDFTEKYADIIIKHYKNNIISYLSANEPQMKNISLEDCNEMFDFMLFILKDQILETKPAIKQQLKSYKKALDNFYKN